MSSAVISVLYLGKIAAKLWKQPSVRAERCIKCWLLHTSAVVLSRLCYTLLGNACPFLLEIFFPEKLGFLCTRTYTRNGSWAPEPSLKLLCPKTEPPILPTAWFHCSQMDDTAIWVYQITYGGCAQFTTWFSLLVSILLYLPLPIPSNQQCIFFSDDWWLHFLA